MVKLGWKSWVGIDLGIPLLEKNMCSNFNKGTVINQLLLFRHLKIQPPPPSWTQGNQVKFHSKLLAISISTTLDYSFLGYTWMYYIVFLSLSNAELY